MYLQIIFLIVLTGVIKTLFSYSQEGDILTFTAGAPKVKEMQKKYNTKDKVVERLHDLVVYKESFVRWNKFLIISMFTSLVLLHFLKKDFGLGEFIIVTCFVFLSIDLPNRWGYAHISKGIIQEATQLYTHYTALGV